MPILAVQYQGKRKGPDGKDINIPPVATLAQRGPIVNVAISPSDQIVAQLVKKNLPVPQPVTGNALIDTGAVTSCIDVSVAATLNLPVVNVIKMNSASHTGHPANVYPVKFDMVGFGLKFNVPMAAGAPLAAHGLIALLGRDILKQCQLVYTGGMGQIVLAV